VLYRQEHDLNATDQNHSGRISYRLTEHWKGTLDGGYRRDSQPDRDIDVSGLVLGTDKRARTHYGVSSDYTFTEKLTSSISYTYDKDDFDEERSDRIDSTAQNASLLLSHDMSTYIPKTVGRLIIGYERYDYPDEKIVTCSAGVGEQINLSEVFYLLADIGRYYSRSRFEIDLPYFSLDFTDRTRGNKGRMVLGYKGERTTIDLGLSHEIRSLSGRVGAVRRTSYKLNAGHRLNANLWGGLTAEFYTNKANAGQLSINDINESTLSLQPRLRYIFTEDLSLEAAYRFTQTTDREDDETARQSLYSLRAVWRYPLPR
jgi:predicted porin